MTGADALVDELARHGVEVVFGLVGSQTLPILDALYRTGSIRYVAARRPRHESGYTYMPLNWQENRRRDYSESASIQGIRRIALPRFLSPRLQAGVTHPLARFGGPLLILAPRHLQRAAAARRGA